MVQLKLRTGKERQSYTSFPSIISQKYLMN